jgi:hypothetical protein
MLRAADLPPTRMPANLVAAPATSPDEVAGSLRALRRLLAAPGIVGRVQIAARPDDADAMVALIESDLERHGDLELELSLTADPLSVLAPGDIFVAEPGDPRAPEAERACGASVCWTRTPDPLADGVTLPLAA